MALRNDENEESKVRAPSLSSYLLRQQEEDQTLDLHKKKVGRPFKGLVYDQSKEPNVPERRSILRGFKKYFSKKEY